MGNKSPAFQWYPKDILASARVQMMTLAEEGAYRRLLDFCWLNGSIPNDAGKVARLIGKGCTVDVAKVCMEMFIQNEQGELIHERLEVERIKQKEHSEKRKQAADARWRNQGTSADASGKQDSLPNDASALQVQSKSDALHIASSKKDTNVSKKATRLPADFKLTEKLQSWTVANTPNINTQREFQKFTDYYTAASGNKALGKDWNAKWRTWATNAQTWWEERNPAPKKDPRAITDISTTGLDEEAFMTELRMRQIHPELYAEAVQ